MMQMMIRHYDDATPFTTSRAPLSHTYLSFTPAAISYAAVYDILPADADETLLKRCHDLFIDLIAIAVFSDIIIIATRLSLMIRH